MGRKEGAELGKQQIEREKAATHSFLVVIEANPFFLGDGQRWSEALTPPIWIKVQCWMEPRLIDR